MDINMPVEDDIDAPDFKYGALVWKTLGNLVVKAVASPFQFLGSMLGIEREDLKYADFAFGKSVITPPLREKLDNIAQADTLEREYLKMLVKLCAAMQKVSQSELISLADTRAKQICEFLKNNSEKALESGK